MDEILDRRLDQSAETPPISMEVGSAMERMVAALPARRRRRRLVLGSGLLAALVMTGGTAAFAGPIVHDWLTPVSTYQYVASDSVGTSSCRVSLEVEPLPGGQDYSESDYDTFVSFAKSHPWRIRQPQGQPAGKAERLMRASAAVQDLLEQFRAAHPTVDLDASMIITSHAHCVVTADKSSGAAAAAARAYRAATEARRQAARSSH